MCIVIVYSIIMEKVKELLFVLFFCIIKFVGYNVEKFVVRDIVEWFVVVFGSWNWN